MSISYFTELDSLSMDRAPLQPVFPLSRYVYYGEFRYYYGYGNTPPDDYLENASSVIEPAILILGCGDLRSCLYTLWKNFGTINSKRFSGVHFVLNDNSAAVLARNILFLYLCLKTPKEKQQKREWLCAVWAIWFCHELLPKHEAVLNNALSSLIKFASNIKSWSSRGNPLHSLVKFTSAQVLSEMNQVWKMWHGKSVQGVKSVQDMNYARLANQSNIRALIDDGSIASGFFASAIGLIETAEMSQKTPVLYNRLFDHMKAEVVAYYNTGSAFIEDMLSKSPRASSCAVNYTVYERKDGRFTMHYASQPFNCFFHSFQYSAKSLEEIKGPRLNLLVSDSCFEPYPLLANSFQQFSMWFQACSQILNRENGPRVSFTIQCSDAIQFCQELQSPTHFASMDVGNKFDLVYTSNLIDHLAPPNIVLAALPLLKPSSFLFTTTLLYKGISSTAEEYIQACFGFKSELLPIIFGIRCINHEGEKYSSVVSAQPCPFEYGNTSMMNKQWPKVLIWEKIDMHPQKVPALVGDSNITTALYNSISLCVTPLLNSPRGCRTLNHLCIETAMKILQTYAAVLDANISEFQFWSALCDVLLQDDSLKPFLHAIQTQCLLHDLHLHLTVNESTCPICLSVPITQHIGQFTIEVQLPFDRAITPNFMVFVHKSELDDPTLLVQPLGQIDIYIFDSIFGNEKGELKFYCPNSFVENGYSVTLVGFIIGGIGPPLKNSSKEIVLPFRNNRRELASCRVAGISHYFQNTVPFQYSMSSDFGTVASHSGDGDYFETVILLSDATLSKLLSGISASTKRISSSEVKILCGNLKHSIQYPHPIEYERLAVKISQKKKTVTVLASRTFHNFEQEKPLFQVDPENRLTLPPSNTPASCMLSYCGMQFTKKDRVIMEQCCRERALMPPMVNLKESINILFQCCEEHFFHIVLPVGGVHALLIVQNQLHDVQCKTPALDLAYCFLEESYVHRVAPRWQSLATTNVRGICMDESEFQLVKKVFTYFSNRTITKTVQNAKGRLQLLTMHQIDRFFSRAVVYPLYADPDLYVLDMDFTMSDETSSTKLKSTLKNCSNCKMPSKDLKKCANCGQVRYCSRECQKKHWKEHKPSCLKSVEMTKKSPATSLSRCDGCGEMFASLKKCPCHKAAYCSVACQKKEWPKHKTVCTNRLLT